MAEDDAAGLLLKAQEDEVVVKRVDGAALRLASERAHVGQLGVEDAADHDGSPISSTSHAASSAASSREITIFWNCPYVRSPICTSTDRSVRMSTKRARPSLWTA